jgi:hypothetical protein
VKIKLDGNLPHTLVGLLSQLGHDVDTVPSEGLAGKDDGEVWTVTQAAGRFLITQDLGFSDERKYTPGTHEGVLLVRLPQPGRFALTERILGKRSTNPVLRMACGGRILRPGGIPMALNRTAVRMARLVAQWRMSEEAGASLARRHHVPTWTFWYWRRKLAATTARAVVTEPAPTFRPVQVTSDETSEPVIEIVLRGGERLQVRAGAPPDLVQAAVRAVRAAC